MTYTHVRLKRLATSDYACIACLGVVFVITVIVAFYIVFKSPCDTRLKTDRPGRRIFRGINLGDVGLKADEDRNDWDDSKLGGDGVMSGLPSTDFDDTGAKGFNLGGDNQFSELSRIIDMNKLNYDKSSQRLKNFYTKLLRTDDQIKNLRKGLGDSTMMKYTDKIKRSLNHRDINLNEVNNDVKHKKRNGKTKRTKRHDNYTLPASYVIENEKIMIHYPDNVRKKVPKCSHTPKESKSHSHETDLKHPFYKHTQRLDELLDKFIDKNLPQLLSDPFGIDMFQSDVETTTNRVDSAGNRKVTDAKNVAVINDPIISSPSDFFKITSRGSSDPDVILGVTTVMSSSKHVKSLIDRVPNIRKLMQAYEESDDNLGYDDLEEVLTDDVDNHDDPEVKIDRNKRSNPDRESHPVFEGGKSKPVGVPIPNWKGPLPLYPDEMNTMIKQEQSHKPTNTKEENSLMNRPISNDIEYIEDYLSSKYEKLANMAQAYSDYGVLDEKKEAKNANQNPEKLNVEHRVKLSVDNPTMHYSLGRDVTEIKFKADGQTTKRTSDDNLDLAGNVSFKRRSLKSIDMDKTDYDTTDNGMDLSDFFRMISTWFSSLASTSLDNFDDQAGNKSRVLMSVGESNNTSEDNNNNVAVHDGNDNEKNDADQIAMSNSTDPPANLMTTSKDANVKSSKDVESHENKTVVKRSLSDSGLVFWSDIYDDEYGVKVDPLEKEVDERSREGRGFMKRSKYWLQDKIRSIADNIKDFRYVGGKKDADTYNSYPKVFKRHAKLDKVDVDDTNKVTNFAELKVKMRSVCKEAAKAVQQTRKMQGIYVKGQVKMRESQSDSAANTIMMQLVRMMTDLVDFQVKQKTCIKLPPDLQNFLEWLTTPSQGQTSRQSSVDKDFLDETNVLGKVKDLDSPRPNDEKAEYLESIRAVEDLLHEYDLMNDEEKFSNMYSNQPSLRFRREIKPQTASYVKSNIKRRLKRRLRKLMRNFNKKHTRSTADDSRVTDSVRYNNDGNVINNKIDKFAKKDDGSNEFKINSEPMKNNHGVYEDRNADNNRDLFDNNDVFDKEFSNNNDKVDVNNDMMKRNLQDVYYRALSEAKKVTTVKPNGG
ncbi:uncharacterized protein MAL13P1.304-like [Amyelois transitella]|uniref:uncharacterized protein MAL13P1.304-like n=1 Tax=Amyelois transitella TaxID=680683 RepID=UPI00298F9DB6|nr:uncharacterized protein MAL13P1.304-like [Amyelois transitella]